jgi:hypothetical protein
MQLEKLEVKCYSGRMYAERPISFLWQDEQYEIEEIEQEWFEPGEKHFNIRIKNKQSLHLWYSEKEDQWHLILRSLLT